MADGEWFTSNLRSIIREPLFGEQIDGLAIDPRRFDEAMAGLEYSLAKAPEIFPGIPGTPLSRAILSVYSDSPPLRIFFTYDATQVRLICIEFAEPE